MKQNDRVLRLLRENGRKGLNTTDLMAPACDGMAPILRLAARIRDLQDQGYGIRSERKLNGTATYFLVRDVERDSDQSSPEHDGTNPTHAPVAVPLDAADRLFDSAPAGVRRSPGNAIGGEWEAA